MCAKRPLGCCNFCSSSATLRPVFTAVELATDRSTALRLGILRWGSGVLNMLWSREAGLPILSKPRSFVALGAMP